MSEPRLDRAVRGIGEATSLVFLAAVALTFYEVILRYFFNAPTTWVHEVSIFLTAAAFIVAGSYTLQRKDHIRISLVFDMLPARGRRLLTVVNLLIALYFLCSAAVRGRGAGGQVAGGHGAHRHRLRPADPGDPEVASRRRGRADDPPGPGAAVARPAGQGGRLMDIGLLTLVIVLAMAALLVMGLPLAFVTGAVAVTVGLLKFGPAVLGLISSRIYSFMSEYVLVAVPMFILMASLMERSGVARDLYRAMHVWAGGLRGGLAVQTLLAAMIMAAMTGIIGGEIVLLGMIALPQMLRLGYNKNIAIGTICAGGSLGTMIPPSVVLIIYGLTANVPIGDLFLATIAPAFVLAGLYLFYILVRCNLNPRLGPPAPPEERDMPVREKLALFKDLVLPLTVAAWVLGSIYAGIASVSEAAGMGVVGTLAAALVRRELSWKVVRESIRQTMNTCGMLLWLTFGATALIGVYNLLGGMRFVRSTVTGLELEPVFVIAVMMGILVVMGLFMDWVGILLLTVPIFVPIVAALGYDPVWFGVLFCMNMQVSYLSPPFGPAAFYLKGVAPPGITLQDIFAGVLPFIVLQLIGLGLVLTFPEIALWLPRLVYGG